MGGSPVTSSHFALQTDLDVLRARLDALEGLSSRPVTIAPCDILEMDEAVALSGRRPCTIRKWAKVHRLGRRLGGRWLLSRSRFNAFVEGDVR